jgi:hypothetical protein
LEYAEDVSADDRAGGVNAMDRSELIQRLVLSEISDDYESVDQIILRNVARDGAKLGLSIERSDIVDALRSLIEDGLAKAYLLSSREPYSTELPSMPALDVVEEDFKTYFYITKKGIDFHLSDNTWWPFDR